MTIPLQFASLYDRQEDFVWSSCLLDLGTDLLVGNMVFVILLTSHFLFFLLKQLCLKTFLIKMTTTDLIIL